MKAYRICIAALMIWGLLVGIAIRGNADPAPPSSQPYTISITATGNGGYILFKITTVFNKPDLIANVFGYGIGTSITGIGEKSPQHQFVSLGLGNLYEVHTEIGYDDQNRITKIIDWRAWDSTLSHNGAYVVSIGARYNVDGTFVSTQAYTTFAVNNLLVQDVARPHVLTWGGPGSAPVTFSVPLSDGEAPSGPTHVRAEIHRLVPDIQGHTQVATLDTSVIGMGTAQFTWDGIANYAGVSPGPMERGVYVYTILADHYHKEWVWDDTLERPLLQDMISIPSNGDSAYQDSENTSLDPHPTVEFLRHDSVTGDNIFLLSYKIYASGNQPSACTVTIYSPDFRNIREEPLPTMPDQLHQVEIRLPGDLTQAPGQYTFMIWGKDNLNQPFEAYEKGHRSRTFTERGCWTIKPDLVMQDLPEETQPTPHEENPGGVVMLNNDDDNENGIPDKDESGPIEGEDDLVPVAVTFYPARPTNGVMRLGIYGPIRVWADPTKTTSISDWTIWDASTEEVPSVLYVEGTGYSMAPCDAGLQLSYSKDGVYSEDMVSITVCGLSMQASKEAIMTGAVSDALHQCVVTAATYPVVQGLVTFEIEGTTGYHRPASLSATSVALDANGLARTVLTSSDLVQDIPVKASLHGNTKLIHISQSEWQVGGFTFTPAELPADGQSTASIEFTIAEPGTLRPVAGHTIYFGIDSIADSSGNLVTDTGIWPLYGTFIQSPATTDSNGKAYGRFQVGTKSGTIYIHAEDDNVWQQ